MTPTKYTVTTTPGRKRVPPPPDPGRPAPAPVPGQRQAIPRPGTNYTLLDTAPISTNLARSRAMAAALTAARRVRSGGSF